MPAKAGIQSFDAFVKNPECLRVLDRPPLRTMTLRFVEPLDQTSLMLAGGRCPPAKSSHISW